MAWKWLVVGVVLAMLAAGGWLRPGSYGVVSIPQIVVPAVPDNAPDLAQAVAFCLEVISTGGDGLEPEVLERRSQSQWWGNHLLTKEFGDFDARYQARFRPTSLWRGNTGFGCSVGHRGLLDAKNYSEAYYVLQDAISNGTLSHDRPTLNLEQIDLLGVRRTFHGAIIRLDYDDFSNCGEPRAEPRLNFYVATFERYVDPREGPPTFLSAPVICF